MQENIRGDLQTLLSTLFPDILVTNEPASIECGALDYVITKTDRLMKEIDNVINF